MAHELRKLVAVVLAAGGSSRLGQPKQLLCHKGETLLQRSVRLAQGVCDQGVVVVLGAQAGKFASLLRDSGCQIVVNQGWQAGLASSLKTGLDCISPTADGVLLLLCDQPRLTPADIGLLVAAWQAHPEYPVAAEFNDVLGSPAIVPRALAADMQNSLSGDSGAGVWLRSRGDVRSVRMQNAALDLDTPDDLALIGAE